ncbi:hypothetical protein V6N13_087645 [Hibiscus sabdariffa]|uniref:Uncharacterized protein n=1 Tax=Hibiscus sabdariffa TaxID=183260 RepID=A0ABR2FWW7_9ROSI
MAAVAVAVAVAVALALASFFSFFYSLRENNLLKMSNGSDYLKGIDMDFYTPFDNWGVDFSLTPDQQFGDMTSPLFPDDNSLKGQTLSHGKACDFVTGPGGDIQQPEYTAIEAQSGANEPPLSPGDDQEKSSSSKSTGSKKRKSVAKGEGEGKGKEKIGRQNQGTFCIDESSNSKQPEKPTKKPDKYEDLIKHKDVGKSARVLLNRVNNRTKSARDIQLQLRRTYEQMEPSLPLRAKLQNHEEDLKATEAEIKVIKQDISDIPVHHKEGKLTKADADDKLIEIEKKKLNKFIQDLQKAQKGLNQGRQEVEKARNGSSEDSPDLQKAQKGLNEGRQEVEKARKWLNEDRRDLQNKRNGVDVISEEVKNRRNGLNEISEEMDKTKEKTKNLESIFTDNTDQHKKLSSEITHLLRETITGHRITQKWTQERMLLEGSQKYKDSNLKEKMFVEVATEEVTNDVDDATKNLLIQYYDGEITDIDKKIHALRAKRDEYVGIRAILRAQAP